MRSYPTGPAGRAAATLAAATLAVAVPLFAGAGPAVADDGRPDRDFTIEDPRITESSGLAASRAHPGVYWT
ncbi:WD40 repeat domain-containing protein, partial [Streptomyces anulatus]